MYKSGQIIPGASWDLGTAREFGVVQSRYGVASTPIVVDDLLIVIVGGSDPEYQRVSPDKLHEVQGNGSAIVALDKLTGKPVYAVGNDLASYASPRAATINGIRWVFAFLRGGLIGFEPTTGRIDFEYPWRSQDPKSVNASTPVVFEDMVFLSTSYDLGSSLLRVKPGGFDVVWRDDPADSDKRMAMHFSTPIYHDGYLYGSTGHNSKDAELRCINWETGEMMWSEPGLNRMSLLYVDGHFVCLTEYGKLFLVKSNHEKFEKVAEVTLREQSDTKLPAGFSVPQLLSYPCWTAPALSRGLLYIRSPDRLVCLDLIPPQSVSSNPYDGPPGPSKQEDSGESTGSEAHRTAESQGSGDVKTRPQKSERPHATETQPATDPALPAGDHDTAAKD